jgi:hypothetical protein
VNGNRGPIRVHTWFPDGMGNAYEWASELEHWLNNRVDKHGNLLFVGPNPRFTNCMMAVTVARGH